MGIVQNSWITLMKGLALVGPTDSPAPKLTSLVEIKQTNREMFWKIEPYSHSVYTNEAANGFTIVDSSLSFQSRETSRKKNISLLSVRVFMTLPSCSSSSSSCMCSEMWKQLWWCVSKSFSLSCSEESENQTISHEKEL